MANKSLSMDKANVSEAIKTLSDLKANFERNEYSTDDIDILNETLNNLHSYPYLMAYKVGEYPDIGLSRLSMSDLFDAISSKVIAADFNSVDVEMMSELLGRTISELKEIANQA